MMGVALAQPRMSEQVHGVVLAGGRSVRLGRDKARVKVDGCDLLGRTTDLLARVTGKVWVIGRDPSTHGLNLDWALDEIPGQGPLGGIVTALKVTGRSCLVTSCDLPYLDESTLDRLLIAYHAAEGRPLMTTYGQMETGYIEALVSIYAHHALPVLEAALANGQRKLAAIIPREKRLEIPYSQDEARPFFNLNTPAELKALRAGVWETEVPCPALP
jgi:molybdopterin-guanine dinucleotide biosynthesis protein A